jgi:hypothetical protein
MKPGTKPWQGVSRAIKKAVLIMKDLCACACTCYCQACEQKQIKKFARQKGQASSRQCLWHPLLPAKQHVLGLSAAPG